MSTALAPKTPAEVWQAQDLALIRQTSAANTTDTEFRLFMRLAARYELDPLSGQIWCQKLKSQDGSFYPAQIFVEYYSLLAIAQRENQLAGIETHCLYDDKGQLTGAVATVWKQGSERPFVAEVDLEEYTAPAKNPVWVQKPKTTLKKVATVQALRLAFNLAGLYIQEEFDAAQPELVGVFTSVAEKELPQAVPAKVLQLPPRAAQAVANYEAKKAETIPAPMTKGQFAGWLKKICEAFSPESLAEASRNVALSFGQAEMEQLYQEIKGVGNTDPWRQILQDYVLLRAEQDARFCWGWDKDTHLPFESQPLDIPF